MNLTQNTYWMAWTEGFLGMGESSLAPMTPDISRLMVNLLLEDYATYSAYLEVVESELAGDFLFKVLDSRLAHLKVVASRSLKIFVRMLCTSPADAVMWAHALKRMGIDRGQDLDLRKFVDAFPIGLPTAKAMSEQWDAQKRIGGAADNFLDTVSA